MSNSATSSGNFDADIPSTSVAASLFNGHESPTTAAIIDLTAADGEAEANGDADGDEYWTAAELLKELTRAYLDEAMAPKILPEKLDLVDKLLQHTTEIERIMARNANKKSVTYSAHKMELCRIEFVVNSYLRTRMKKMEQSPAECMQEHSERLRRAVVAYKAGKPLDEPTELLDRRELRFVQGLQKANAALFDDTFLGLLPASLQWLPIPWAPSANDTTRVFIEVLKEGLEEIAVPNLADPNMEMLLNLGKGTRHLVPFNSIRPLLEAGHVCLL